MQNNFPYNVTVNAPDGYPVEVHEGWLMDSKKEYICAMPKAGVSGDGWIYDGSEAGQGGDAIPYHLNLTYVAYAEKKFYTVDADLPADKILEEFRKGFLVQGNVLQENGLYNQVPGTYNILTIGAAPGGVIVVWLSGNHHRVEICRLQAKEVFVDKNDFLRFKDNNESQQQFFDTTFKIVVSDSIQTIIKEKGIPYGLWDKYRERFKYRFVFKPYDGKDLLIKNANIYYNGEEEVVYAEDLSKKEYTELPLPYKSRLRFKLYHTAITFDDQEMLSVFGKLKKEYPDEGIDIVVVPTFMYNDFKLSAKCGKTEIPLKDYKIKGVWGG